MEQSDRVKFFLNESTSTGSLVFSLSIIDRDSGDNGRVTWKLDRSSIWIPFELIRLTESTGELRTNGPLDREQISQYDFVLEAMDNGRPNPKSTRLNFTIEIIDINDNPPQFLSMNLNVTISEHLKIDSNRHGYEIFRLYAQDPDQGANGEIIYSIIDNDENIFRIDPKTGVISAQVEFDRHQKNLHVLEVEAHDQGKNIDRGENFFSKRISTFLFS